MNVKSFTKDDQTVANEFNKFFSSVVKSTIEKNQLLANKFNYAPAPDTFIPRNYPTSEQFSLPRWNALRLQTLLIQYLTTKLQELTKYHLV